MTVDTRDRLLDAAEDLFAQSGFDAVSIRDIATAAEVNVAAVNYHFQAKDKLYHEVLNRAIAGKRQRYLDAIHEAAERSSEDVDGLIRAFFQVHFSEIFRGPRGGNFMQLLVREMHHGNEHTTRIIVDQLMPIWQELGQLLQRARPEISGDDAQWIVGSLHGQLIHFTMRWHKAHCGRWTNSNPDALKEIFPPLADDVERYIDTAIDHITRFSVGGLDAIAAARANTSTPEGTS